ncbi:YciI family protein [Ruegeria sp.]|uniref:YciI family protein n=1 Tax=Ruegeria sp. TaxID=1879320 RepID=UPI0023109BB6|nr:YciI family protein [Ruegeria sp.]MDA7967050.1 YciI family protein [Ruegeria sp.]
MLYTIHFYDNADANPDIRPRFMQQHLSFLNENKAVIRAAGPLREADGAVKSGLWLVDVETVDQAWALVKADPFWPTGLRDTIEIKHWAQVFADGQALV